MDNNNKAQNYMRLVIPGKSVNEAFSRAVVGAFAVQLDVTVDELADIKTAVSEAVTNSIIHGYSDKKGEVVIECKILGDVVDVTIIDYGKGIKDIETAMRPLYTSCPDDERSGMGFTVMQSFMDEVEVSSEVGKGTTVHMTKRIGQNGGAEEI